MGRPAHGTSAPASVGWLLVLGGLLGGLFAMHGLADHDASGHPMPGMAMAAPPGSMGGSAVAPGSTGMGPMAGTCLAFLTLVLLLLVELAAVRRTPRPGSVLRTRVRPSGVRERAPPMLELLSVRRC